LRKKSETAVASEADKMIKTSASRVPAVKENMQHCVVSRQTIAHKSSNYKKWKTNWDGFGTDRPEKSARDIHGHSDQEVILC
jgi:hypothetical protein